METKTSQETEPQGNLEPQMSPEPQGVEFRMHGGRSERGLLGY